MKTLILLSLLVAGTSQGQYMAHMNDNDNTAGRDWSPNPLRPQAAQPLQVQPMPNYNNQNNLNMNNGQQVNCRTVFGQTYCN